MDKGQGQEQSKSTELKSNQDEPSLGKGTSLKRANDDFHRLYQGLLAEKQALIGTSELPVVAIHEHKVHLFTPSDMSIQSAVPPLYHKIKAIAHQATTPYMYSKMVLGVPFNETIRKTFMERHALLTTALQELYTTDFEEARDADTLELLKVSADWVYKVLTENVVTEEALSLFENTLGPILERLTLKPARGQIDILHSIMEKLYEKLSPDEWRNLHVVISGAHQARADETSMQYFSWLFGERQGEGASKEDKIIFAEGISKVDDALELLAKHIVDEELSVGLFKDKTRLQRDVLSHATKLYIKTLIRPWEKQ